MKKKLSTIFAFLFVVFQANLFAQAPDTVLVPFQDSKGPKDALTRAILGDTTATGQRNNINRVYRLERGSIYYLTGRVYIDKFPLKLIADNDETKCPPVIAPFPLSDGSIPRISIQVSKDAHFKNIYFQGFAPTGTRNTSDRPLILAGEGNRFIIEHCIIDGYYVAGIYNSGLKSVIFIKDCLFRNIVSKYMFKGTVFFNATTSTIDTLSITNTTVFNGNSYFLCSNRAYAKYILADHNTVFLTLNNPFYAPYVSNINIRNNIFFSTCANGETTAERRDGYYDWDNEREAIFSIDTIPTDIANANGITDANRKVTLANNVYFWPQKIQDFWAANDSVDAPLWMNNRTKAFFTNKTQFPNITEQNTLNVDPGFNTDVIKLVDSLYRYVNEFRTKGNAREFYYNPSGGSLFPASWPIPENLAFTNSTLLNAADGGYPVGDLNWYPDKKKQWENWIKTGVEKDPFVLVPKAFKLDQNYPNPFNPTTSISFSLPKESVVNLKVFNSLGQEITKLISGEKYNIGKYNVTWNGRDAAGKIMPSGIYFYQILTNEFSMTKKMLLIK